MVPRSLPVPAGVRERDRHGRYREIPYSERPQQSGRKPTAKERGAQRDRRQTQGSPRQRLCAKVLWPWLGGQFDRVRTGEGTNNGPYRGVGQGVPNYGSFVHATRGGSAARSRRERLR